MTGPSPTGILFDALRVGYAITDVDLTITRVGGRVSLLSPRPGTLRGADLRECIPELVGNEESVLALVVGELDTFTLEAVNRGSPDTESEAAFLNITLFPHRTEAAATTSLVCVVQDVSSATGSRQRATQSRNELRLLGAKLEAANADLQAANLELRRVDEMKAMLVAVATHEIRTPLTSVLGYVDLLLTDPDGELTEQQRDVLTLVATSAERMLSISNNLLDETRLESGRLSLILRPASAREIVGQVVSELRTQIDGRSQTVDVDLPDDLPALLCDRTRTIQILSNLLSNASKYTPERGRIHVSASPAADPTQVLLTVRDTGVGIPADEQGKLFERFFRARTAFQTGAVGSGLGLHITRSLVEMHGGQIWFESTEGAGTAFFVTLPTAE
ncbi:MAG: HAMP domain-containing sensor histidine kinase [Chloroflexota bacterium]